MWQRCFSSYLKRQTTKIVLEVVQVVKITKIVLSDLYCTEIKLWK